MRVRSAFVCWVAFAGGDKDANSDANSDANETPTEHSAAYWAMMQHIDDMEGNHGRIVDDFAAKIEKISNDELNRLDQRWNDRFGRMTY
ncbi:MAG: hypothetical protein KVP17_002057 [Porospora cf. gigantea B]|uniref:uncharacterized protein n=1 Tax=Porospora cf. gigantea B TaxID=2853592 RepID=UPI0035719C79|nr:MAG: hypothetical protein KVP17_002057 [Porospora cf. gigantea B]